MASLQAITAFFKGIDDQQAYDIRAQEEERRRLESEQDLEFKRQQREENARLFQFRTAAAQDEALTRTLALEDLTAGRPAAIAARDTRNREIIDNARIYNETFGDRSKANEAQNINNVTEKVLNEKFRADTLSLTADNVDILNPNVRKIDAQLVALNPTRAKQTLAKYGIPEQYSAQMSVTEITELLQGGPTALQAWAQRKAAFDSTKSKQEAAQTLVETKTDSAEKIATARDTASAARQTASIAAKAGTTTPTAPPTRPQLPTSTLPSTQLPVAPQVQLGRENGLSKMTSDVIAQGDLVRQLEASIPKQFTGGAGLATRVANPAYTAWLHSNDGRARLEREKTKLQSMEALFQRMK